MQSREQVAGRAGSLVTERVRAVMETANGRAERIRRDAADEAHGLDSRRMEAASRIMSQIQDLEGALGRARQQMQAEHSAEGSVDENHLIEDDAASASGSSATTAVELEEPATEAETKPTYGNQPAEGEGDLEADDAQRSPFSFLRRRRAEEEAASGPAGAEAPGTEQDESRTYTCAVCGREFAGGEDELESLGWVHSASGEVICADCRGAGWLDPSS